MENQNINQTKNINLEQNSMNKKEHDFRNIMLSILGVFIILAAVSGGTYAYYAFSATNNTTVNGTAATANLTLAVTKSSTDATGPMVPQPATTIAKALVGTDSKTCVDGNGNTVCQVYQIAITNSSSAATFVRGYLKFTTSGKFTNLKWVLLGQSGTSFTKYTSYTDVTYGLTSSSGTAITTATTVTATSATFSTSSTEHGDLFVTSTNLDKTGGTTPTKYFYIVVWINETGAVQNSSDYGTFTGTVYFEAANGQGLTSTFTAST